MGVSQPPVLWTFVGSTPTNCVAIVVNHYNVAGNVITLRHNCIYFGRASNTWTIHSTDLTPIRIGAVVDGQIHCGNHSFAGSCRCIF